MALDGIYLSFLIKEIGEKILGSRVEKIYQPAKDEIIIHFKGKDVNEKLYLCASAGSARINITEEKVSNPQNPPMFCMLLRKHIGGAKLANIRQLSFDRVCFLDFETRNEMGDEITVSLSIEIMSRHSNIILINDKNIVVDSIKRVDLSMSQQRQILPGIEYTNPPAQEKINIMSQSAEQLIDEIILKTNQSILEKSLIENIQGISPIIAGEIANFTLKGDDKSIKNLNTEQKNRLLFFIKNIISSIANNSATPTIVYNESQTPKDFAFCDIHQFGYKFITKQVDSFSSLLDEFYKEKTSQDRVKQRSKELLKLIMNLSERTSKKIVLQTAELEKSEKKDEMRIFGDIINANLYKIKKGDKYLLTENFYDNNKEIKILLNERLTPPQNAQKYYKNYKKSITAIAILTEQIEKAKEEIIYIDSVFDAVSRTNSEDELNEIREELFKGGYVRRNKNDKTKIKKKPLKPKKYISSDGFSILCGRNNIQNDILTLKTASKSDLWFHTKQIAGSHTIILTENKSVPDTTIIEACQIAAFNSNGRLSAQVPVDYTEIKNVKKPIGAKPGMVIYVKNKTAFVKPDETLIDKLKCD